MKIFTVLNDSDILDHPWVLTFKTEIEAQDFITELYRAYWVRSDMQPQILPEPDEHWSGLRFDFTGGYCTEWCYLFETEIQ